MLNKNNSVTILDAATTTTTGDVHTPWGTQWAFEAYGTTSTGSGAATIVIQVANTNTNLAFKTMGTIDLTLGTTLVTDGFVSNAPWKYVRAKVTAISGTDASVTVVLSNQGV